MADQSNIDPEHIAELRGFLHGFAMLHQALGIGLYDYDVVVLPIEGSVEETLQTRFSALGQKLKPPVKQWDITLVELDPWEQVAEEMFSRWLLADEDLRDYYRERRLRDPRPGEVHVGNNDIARVLREQLAVVVGPEKPPVWGVSLRALVGASDRYLATLDDHLAFELGGELLLLTFAVNR